MCFCFVTWLMWKNTAGRAEAFAVHLRCSSLSRRTPAAPVPGNILQPARTRCWSCHPRSCGTRHERQFAWNLLMRCPHYHVRPRQHLAKLPLPLHACGCAKRLVPLLEREGAAISQVAYPRVHLLRAHVLKRKHLRTRGRRRPNECANAKTSSGYDGAAHTLGASEAYAALMCGCEFAAWATQMSICGFASANATSDLSSQFLQKAKRGVTPACRVRDRSRPAGHGAGGAGG